jgi:5-methylthioadenosine/S-adenosylhomocysteine deaminase
VLIKDGIVITMDAQRRIHQPGVVAVSHNRIVSVGDPESVPADFVADEVLSAAGMVVLPGLVNTHMHSQNALIRGTADDEAGAGWLNKYINPMHAAMTEEDAYAISLLSYLEALKTGTTALVDMGRFMHRCADAAQDVGIRAVLAPYAADIPEYSYLESVEENERLVKRRHGDANGRISVWFGVEFITYSTPQHYRKVRQLANEYGVGIHLHANCRVQECEYARRHYGKPTVELLYDWGVLGPDCLAAHCVVLNAYEIQALAATGTHVAHCPVAGMKVALGVCPVPELRAAGVNVALGTDGAAENNSIDMLETLKFAALLHKLNKLDPLALSAETVLEMAMLAGARAIGQERQLGSLEPGKIADLIIIQPKGLGFVPLLTGDNLNFIPLLVYSGHGDVVHTVMVDGRIVIQNYRHTSLDESRIAAQATTAAVKLLERRQQYVEARDRSLDRAL